MLFSVDSCKLDCKPHSDLQFEQLMRYRLIDECQAFMTMLVYLDLTEG